MKYFQILLLLGINFSTLLLGQSIEIPHKMMKQDATLNIPIFIYDVSNLESIQLKIEYDETIVNALEIIENPVGILDDGYTFTTNISESGIIHIGIGSNSVNVFSGSGWVAQITFQAVGQLGDYSPLSFLDAQINSELVLGTTINGSIEIILDELTITAVDQSGIGSAAFITLGMCETCTDGWRYGEDEYDIPPNPQSAYTDIYFFNPDWYGQTDINDITCDQVKFATDYRQQHSTTQLVSWGISGSTDGLSSDTPIILSWVSNNSDNFKMFLYVGDEDRVDMQLQNSFTISQSELNNINNEPNIWVKLGVCAETGETSIHYQDFDGDGLGSSISEQYCTGYVPDGWVTNSDDEDDYCYSNHYDCMGVCDGTAVEDCNGECEGSATEDECDVCNGDDSFCTDCNGDTNGSAYVDGCGECVSGNTGKDECPYDCLGIPDGPATTDNCGNCDNDSSNDCVQDCAGEWGGNLVLDECGICGGPGSTSECGCNDIQDGDCDCNGNTLDECGICDGDNSTCTDCYGVINGGAYIDACGNCDNDSSNDCVQDCNGDWGGVAFIDNCGICGGDGIPEGGM